AVRVSVRRRASGSGRRPPDASAAQAWARCVARSRTTRRLHARWRRTCRRQAGRSRPGPLSYLSWRVNVTSRMSKVFANIAMSLDGYMAPEGMTLEHWEDPKYKDWGAKWGSLMAW